MKKTKPSWEARPHTASSYSFTPREFRYFLFGKKICPSCGGKLQRQKQFFSPRGALPKTFRQVDIYFINTEKVKYYYYTYACLRCGQVYPLRDLAERAR